MTKEDVAAVKIEDHVWVGMRSFISKGLNDTKSPTMDIFKEGDVVIMFHPNSLVQMKAYKEGVKLANISISTHAGKITSKNGQKYVTHNVNGTLHTEKLEVILKGAGVYGDRITRVYRVNNKDTKKYVEKRLEELDL